MKDQREFSNHFPTRCREPGLGPGLCFSLGPCLAAAMIGALLSTSVLMAAEITVANDSAGNSGNVQIEAGFVAGEAAAAWVTSPCAGNVVAAQVEWRSLSGSAAPVVESSLDISRGGVFPNPGAVVQSIANPQLTDGAINEFRHTDPNNTVPVMVPVAQSETFVIALTFADAPSPTGPSVTVDIDGCQAGRNAIYADFPPFAWVSACALGVTGDFVIRAVVDCSATSATVTPSAGVNGSIDPSTPQTVSVGATTTFTVTPNAGFRATVGGTCGGSLVGTTYTTNMITVNCTVIASFSDRVFTDGFDGP